MKELFRRLLLPAVLLAAVLVVVGTAAELPKGEKVALLVGVTEYDHSKLPNLQYAAADVEELAAVLRQSGYSRVILLTNRAGARDERLLPVRENVRRELAALLAKRTKRDTVLVAFSGHGVQLTVKGKDEPFFCPKDGNPTKSDTLVALDQLYTQLDDSGAGVKLLLVDACRTNPADKGAKGIDGRNLPELREGMGALFSCRPGERSYEHKEWKHGAFFSVVLEALRPGGDGRLGADGDGDGVVDFGELARYLSKHVPVRVKSALGEEVEQHPLPVQTLDPLVPLVRLETSDKKVKAAKNPAEIEQRLKELKALETNLGADHLEVAKCLLRLAALYQDQGQYAVAEALFLRSLRIMEPKLGKDHLDVASALDQLADLYRALGQNEKAEPLSKRSAAIKASKRDK